MIAVGIGAVREYLEARRVVAQVLFGRRERARRVNQGAGGANRIVFQPGDDGGRLGQIGPVHQPGPRDIAAGISARSLANLSAVYTVYVWASAPASSGGASQSRTRDELADFEAAEDLLQWTVRAVHWAFDGHSQWGELSVVPEPVELANGVELKASLTVGFPLYDTPNTRVFPVGKTNKGTPPP